MNASFLSSLLWSFRDPFVSPSTFDHVGPGLPWFTRGSVVPDESIGFCTLSDKATRQLRDSWMDRSQIGLPFKSARWIYRLFTRIPIIVVADRLVSRSKAIETIRCMHSRFVNNSPRLLYRISHIARAFPRITMCGNRTWFANTVNHGNLHLSLPSAACFPAPQPFPSAVSSHLHYLHRPVVPLARIASDWDFGADSWIELDLPARRSLSLPLSVSLSLFLWSLSDPVRPSIVAVGNREALRWGRRFSVRQDGSGFFLSLRASLRERGDFRMEYMRRNKFTKFPSDDFYRFPLLVASAEITWRPRIRVAMHPARW